MPRRGKKSAEQKAQEKKEQRANATEKESVGQGKPKKRQVKERDLIDYTKKM